MTRTSSYTAREQHIDLESELNRLHNQVHLNWEKEARNLIQFGLGDGMSVLEIGSGPGFVTELLAQLVPNGSITGLEIDPDLVERSTNYLQDRVSSKYRIVQGSVMNIPFTDNTFDFAVARLVFEHLPDQIAAYPQFDPDRVLPLVDEGVVSEAEYHSFRAAIEGFMSAEEPFFLRIILMVCGEKP